MQVTLISHTTDPLDTLLYTKSTRLQMTASGMAAVKAWTPEKRAEELTYMRNTIQSSWEFVDFTFAIEGVTRAFTHQLVRHRVGTSFAQQAQRVVLMQHFGYLATGDVSRLENENESRRTGEDIQYEDGDSTADLYSAIMEDLDTGYASLLAAGVKPQDARGVLPTNILTNIVFKANLRTLHDMALKRLCVKAQGEFQDVFNALVDEVTAKFPWTADFLKVQCAWNGTCLFPSLPVEQCHVKPYVYNPETCQSYGQDAGMNTPMLPLPQLYTIHRNKRTEIQPVVQT